MTTATTIANSTLTQDAVQRLLINPLTQSSSYLAVGFPVFTSNGEPIQVPSMSTFGTPSYVAQGSAIPELNPTTSEITLLASSVQSVKVIARMSNELIRQSVVNVEAAFSQKLVSDVARILDSALWNGSGTLGAPKGIAQFAGNYNAGTVAGTALASGNLFDLQEDALDHFLEFSSLHWAMSPANFTRIRKMTDSYGGRVLQPSLAEGAPGTILGNGYTVTSHMPDTKILLFSKAQVAVGMDNRASVTIDGSRYLDYDEVALRVTARYDTAALNAGGVLALTIS